MRVRPTGSAIGSPDDVLQWKYDNGLGGPLVGATRGDAETMAYFVALDGGGTKTECWFADENSVLGRASTGSVKLMNVDEATATAGLRNLIRDAASEAGVALGDVTNT